MNNKAILVIALSSFLSACGGSSGTGTNVEEPVVSLENNIDIAEYLITSSQKSEFTRTEYFYNDGTAAWFNEFGESTSEPTNEAEQVNAFNSLKTINGRVGDLVRIQTKFKPSDFGPNGENGLFLFADRASIFIKVDNTEIIQFRESQENDLFPDFTVLNKYNFTIPRFYKTNDSLLLDSTNSSRTDTFEICDIEFSPAIDLENITILATGIYSNALTIRCDLFSSQDESELGYRINYYAKNIGLIHSKTSFNAGTIEHVITTRELIDLD